MRSLAIFFGALTALFSIQNSLFIIPAQADPSTLIGFLSGLEGTWQGHGTLKQYNWDGSYYATPYDLNMRVDGKSGDEWSIQSTSRTEAGSIQTRFANAKVVDGNLFIDDMGTIEPVRVTESTPTRLAYQVLRSEYLTGRVYTLIYELELLAPDHLYGKNRVELNGFVTQEDSYGLRRR